MGGLEAAQKERCFSELVVLLDDPADAVGGVVRDDNGGHMISAIIISRLVLIYFPDKSHECC